MFVGYFYQRKTSSNVQAISFFFHNLLTGSSSIIFGQLGISNNLLFKSRSKTGKCCLSKIHQCHVLVQNAISKQTPRPLGLRKAWETKLNLQ